MGKTETVGGEGFAAVGEVSSCVDVVELNEVFATVEGQAVNSTVVTSNNGNARLNEILLIVIYLYFSFLSVIVLA